MAAGSLCVGASWLFAVEGMEWYRWKLLWQVVPRLIRRPSGLTYGRLIDDDR